MLVAIALPVFPRLGILGLTLLLPLVTRLIPRAGPGINSSTALLIVALFAGLLYSRPRLPQLKLVVPFLAFYALALVGYAVVVASGSDQQAPTLAVDMFLSLKSRLWPTLLFFIGFALAPDRELRKRIVFCMVLGLFMHCVSGLYDYATGGSGMGALLHPGASYRAAGVLDANPNHLGGHLAAFSILGLMGLLDSRSPLWMRVVCGAAYALSGMVLVLTQSRGAWLGFLVGHFVWLYYANRKLVVPAVATVVVIAVATYSASMLPETLTKRLDETLTPGHTLYARGGIAGRFDSSVNGRIAFMATGLEIFAHSPVWGHGFGSFRMLAVQYGAKHGLWGMGMEGIAPESIILNTAVEGGIIGLLIYGWLFWTLISLGRKLLHSGDESYLGLALLSIFAAIFVESLSQIALFLPEVSQGLWLTAGLAARALEDQRHGSSAR